MHGTAPRPRLRRQTRTVVSAVAAAACVLVGAIAAGVLPAHAEVPTPAPDESVVTVRTGGDRVGTREVAPLEGVELGLFASATAPDPVDPGWAVCTSDADGDCSFVVPDTAAGGANAGAQFFVRQIEAPAGWYTNPSLRTGAGSGSGSVDNPYVFQTPALAGGETYSSLSDFMFGAATSGSAQTVSEGIWQSSRENPAMPEQCGLDLALVLDLSASLGSQVNNLKAAADSIADTLVGTPSRMAVFGFDGASPASGAGTPPANFPELVSVATPSGAQEFQAQYADWATGSGTNWDQGLWVVADAAPSYEVVVMLTDGNPTRFSADPLLGTGGTTHFRDVENGIYSANAVKAEGSRLVVLGVGSGVDDITRLNLRALSGQTFFDGTNVEEADFYDLADFEQAGAALRELVLSSCEGRVSVLKQIVPAGNTGEDVSGAEPAGPGWQFDASSSVEEIGGLPATQTTTDDGTGSVAFELEYPAGLDSADVSVVETQRPGYGLVTQAGANAVCVDKTADDAPLAVTNTGDPEQPGFTVDVAAGGFVACTVYNRAPASVVVDKTWVINGAEFVEGDQPDGFEAGLTLTGPGGAGASPQDWGEERSGYGFGEQVTIDETVSVPDGCSVDAAVTSVSGEPAEDAVPFSTTADDPARTVEVTNTVTCLPALTLVKEVVNDDDGTAEPGDWTLSATGPTTISGATGELAVTGAVVEAGTYTLAESGPQGYESLGWACVDADGETVPVTADAVEVGDTDAVTCTVTNDDEAAASTPTPTPTDPPNPGPTSSPSPSPGTVPPDVRGPDAGGDGGGGLLPVTGGAPLAIAVLALLLVALGAVLVRRRA